jgi:DNA-binding transcriptional ArsR family regulator
LTALADPTRRTVFEMLAGSESTVGDLANQLPISRPAVSQHLKVLKEAHLVSVRPDGTRRVYALDPDGLGAVRSYFEKFWNAALASYAAAVRESEGENHD